MLKPRLSLASIAVLLSLVIPGLADTVTLKSGEKLEGRILSETDAEVTIEVAITASIKDQRVVKKADVEKIDKVQPDLEAWGALKNIALGEESLEKLDYQRAINVLNGFITQFPQSAHVAEAKEKIAAFQAEAKRVEAGEMKLDGKWLTADEVQKEQVQITGRVLFRRMKRDAAAGRLVEAMNTFEGIEKSASGSSSYPDAVLLARQVLPALKAAADRGRLQLKAQAEERKRRLANSQGGDRAQLETMQKREIAQTEAAVASLDRSGVKWLPLAPATENSLSALSSRAGGVLTGLNQQNVDRMKESLAATDRAKTALEKLEIADAEKALQEANAAWPKNEYIARLQPAFAEAKTKAAEAARAAAAGAKPVVAAAPTAAPTPKPTPNPMPAAVVAEPESGGSILSNPAFWIILFVVLGLAAFTMKALGKFRRADKNDLDE